jgi:outer membrane immunogenic protein
MSRYSALLRSSAPARQIRHSKSPSLLLRQACDVFATAAFSHALRFRLVIAIPPQLPKTSIYQVRGILMRTLLVGIAGMLVIGAVNPASAADTGPPRITKERPIQSQSPVSVFNWTGFYLGGNFGGARARTDFTVNASGAVGGIQLPTTTRSGSTNGSGIVGGGQIGFNYEFPASWVVGVEADIDAAHITGSESACTAIGCTGHNTTLEDFGTVRGRLGYAFNNVLVYGTGGWAWSNVSSTAMVTCFGRGCPGTSLLNSTISFPGAPSGSLSGWTAGGGVEWGFLPNWTLRAEYAHLQFDGIEANPSFSGTVLSFPVTRTAHFSANAGIDVVRVGVNYLFNWGPPPLARY